MLEFWQLNSFNIIILVALVLHTLLSGRVWFWNLFSFVPPIFFTLLFPILVIYNLLTANPLGIVFIVLSLKLIILNSDINLGLFKKNKIESDKTFKVFNWNTKYWEDGFTKEILYKFLKDQNTDIYQLQEYIDENSQPLHCYDELKECFPDHNIIEHGELVTLSRFPIVQTFKSIEANYLRNDIEIHGRIISFYNVHVPVQLEQEYLKNPFKFLAYMRTSHLVRQKNFEALLNDIAHNNNPYYISGDFNTTISMGQMRKILRLTNDSFCYSSYLIPATWEVFGIRYWRIDYNLIGKNSNEIFFVKHDNVTPNGLSDHLGQMVSVGLS